MRELCHTFVLGALIFAIPAWAEEGAVPPIPVSGEPAAGTHATTSGEGGGQQPSEVKAPVRPKVISDIRSLYVLQDAAAGGHREAAMLQKAMLSQISRKLEADIAAADPASLAQDVVGFVLSGGNPGLAEALSERSGISGFDKKLLRGAAFYMRGSRPEAVAAWSTVEAAQLRPSVGGRVSLAQAMLETEDQSRRQHLLSLAIALMPGSLIEESALRRSALSFAGSSHQRRFWKRAEQYLRRFPYSLYSREFLFTVMDNVVGFEKSPMRADLQKLEHFLDKVPTANRRSLYLHLARQASLGYLVNLTEFAARRALRLSVEGSQEAQQAELYSSIYEVVSGETDLASASLRKLQPDLLPSLEQKLLVASLAVADEIRKPADAGLTVDVTAPGNDLTSKITQAAEAALLKADDVIGTPLQ
jgi:chemotaxis protein MotC